MSTTFAELKTEVSEALRDPSLLTFTDAAVGRMVKMAVVEVGKFAPLFFQEDIAPVADTLDYTVRSDYFSGETIAEIEVMRVELWDASTTPHTPMAVIPTAASNTIADSEAGWTFWGGTLHIPRRIWQIIDGLETDRLYRVWGYSPYATMASDADVFEGSEELKWAVVTYAQIVGLRRLVAERELFSQWQTRTGNTDISQAGLAGDYSRRLDEWRVAKHELYVPRRRV